MQELHPKGVNWRGIACSVDFQFVFDICRNQKILIQYSCRGFSVTKTLATQMHHAEEIRKNLLSQLSGESKAVKYEYPSWMRSAKEQFEHDFVSRLESEHRDSPFWPAIRHAVVPGR